MATASNGELIDSNALVYAYYQQSPQHAASRALLDRAQAPGAGLCVAPQNLVEFFAVVMNPRKVTPARSATDALILVAEIQALPGMALLPVPADLVARWTALLGRRPVTGIHAFDAQLAAVMIASGVTTVYTFNAADFQHFADVQVLTP